MQPHDTTGVFVCEHCGENYTKQTKRQRFCTPKCSSAYGFEVYVPAYGDGLTVQTKGAISELRVAVDLLARGFHVYRSMSSTAPWDLVVAIPSGKLVRIEVKSSAVNKNGSVSAYTEKNVYDVVCYATRDSLVYIPPLEDW